jgi:hypothetical protein
LSNCGSKRSSRGLNRFKRADERPFEAVKAISEFNQRAYELSDARSCKRCRTSTSAKLSRVFHPLRFQRWAFSDLNPSLWWLDAGGARP